jgi:hypothetical protein
MPNTGGPNGTDATAAIIGCILRETEDAAALDWEAAHKACSWGAAQILGTNYQAAGFKTVQAFVEAMQHGGAAAHLNAMVAFIKANKLDSPLRQHNWARFAGGYNGPGYAANNYDTKLGAAHQRWSKMA